MYKNILKSKEPSRKFGFRINNLFKMRFDYKMLFNMRFGHCRLKNIILKPTLKVQKIPLLKNYVI